MNDKEEEMFSRSNNKGIRDAILQSLRGTQFGKGSWELTKDVNRQGIQAEYHTVRAAASELFKAGRITRTGSRVAYAYRAITIPTQEAA